MTKLNRDLTVAQYNTKEGGLKGGFTIDDATLEFMTNPEKMVTDTLDSLKQGYYDGKDTVNKITYIVGDVTDKLINSTKTEKEIKIDGLKIKLEKYNDKIAQLDESGGKFKIIFSSSEEAVDYILTKKQLGLEITGNDASLLSQTLWQNTKEGQLAGEFRDYVLNNTDSFKEQGLILNEKNVDAFVNRVIEKSCFINTVYENTVLSISPDKVDSVPKSYGDLYLTAYADGLLQKDGINIKGSVNDLKVIQNFANTISDGNFKIIGASTYSGASTNEVYNSIPSILESSTTGVTGGRIKTGHNMMQYNSLVYDTGQPNNPNGPRPHGTPYSDKIYNEKNTQW